MSKAESIDVPEISGAYSATSEIWGTNLSANQFRIKFKHFIETFKDAVVEEDETIEDFSETRPLYLQKLNEIRLLEEPFLNLNCGHLYLASRELYEQLINYPQEVIPTMDMAINEMFNDIYPDTVLSHQIQVRPFNAEKTKTMRLLNPQDIDTLVTISGMVIRTSSILPQMREGYFKCTGCSYDESYFTLIHNRSAFVDKQMIRLQEDLDDTPVGETPYMAALFAHSDLVNKVQPGDRITVTGIYRAAPFKLNPEMRVGRSFYKAYIDVVHCHTVDTKRLREESESRGLNLSPERIQMIQELSKKPDIYERLARAIAPSIYEHEDVKKGILLQLFGGTSKNFGDTGRGRARAEINILLCGDPGTSKSQLLKYVFDLVPRSQYTSGKGSSAAGLTAHITENITENIIIKRGALVLADNSICCIDEFDKMNESTRSVLHEVMEKQTLSIAKAGIICQLNARTSVLAAANPLESQWNQKKTIVENVHLPHTLLSRFDLIFLLLDQQNHTFDRRLAKHMISLYFRSPEEEDADLLDMSVLRDYIAYAKDTCFPRLSDEESQKLTTDYPRQFETLIRLAEAHAKIRLSNLVEVSDIQESVRLQSLFVHDIEDDSIEATFEKQGAIPKSIRQQQLQQPNNNNEDDDDDDEQVISPHYSIKWPVALNHGARVYEGFRFEDSVCLNCESTSHGSLECKNPPILRCESHTTFTWPVLPATEVQPEGWLPPKEYKYLMAIQGEEAGEILTLFNKIRRNQEVFSREQIQIIYNLLFFNYCCFHCGELLHGGGICQHPDHSLKIFRDHVRHSIETNRNFRDAVRRSGTFTKASSVPTLRVLP